MDVQRIRADFPILKREFHGKPLVYLDSAATSQKPESVIRAEEQYYSQINANVHRGVYALSEEATNAFESSRERVGRFLNANDASEVVFVRGTTEAINLVSSSLARGALSKGDRVLTTMLEHHSNIVPWHLLRAQCGIRLDFVDIDENGELLISDYDRLLDRSTKVVTLAHVSNVLGTVNPVREIAEKAHDVGALVVVDAAQSAPHRKVDVQKLGVDLLAFSGHKTLGPTGVGVLWGREDLLSRMAPCMGGGEMIQEVHTDRVTYREPPARFEAGTPNISGVVALSHALDYLEDVGWDSLHEHERKLTERAFRKSDELLGNKMTIYGPKQFDRRESIFSFALQGVHSHDIASLLDEEGIAVRSGHHCAQPLMERLGVPALTRASPYLYNTVEEIDRLVAGLDKISRFFAKGVAA